jgi:hypothetical protein
MMAEISINTPHWERPSAGTECYWVTKSGENDEERLVMPGQYPDKNRYTETDFVFLGVFNPDTRYTRIVYDGH